MRTGGLEIRVAKRDLRHLILLFLGDDVNGCRWVDMIPELIAFRTLRENMKIHQAMYLNLLQTAYK